MLWSMFILITGVKLLFLPSYRSTDFEVHRNWLAVTHSLPMREWYYDDTSQWTLDYPPLFAYFEWALSQVAKLFDPAMLDVQNLDYASPATILFQRLSVIATDAIYAVGVRACLEALTTQSTERAVGIGLLLCNVGLLMVDHIHFQYNGLLFGVLLLSIAKVAEGRHLQAAFYFAYLLHMKHIFVYVAPVYIVFLFRHYALRSPRPILSLVKLAAIVGGVTLVSFGPFYRHLPQLLSRLFPFKRGLSHAYWAPNFWAFYNFADRVLALIAGRHSGPSMTAGLVQTFRHEVLPGVTPPVTFALTAAFMLPVVLKLWILRTVSAQTFVRAVALCACTAFMFGWHVHEKAVLMVLVPLSLLAALNRFDAEMTLFLSVVAHYSLFPLLYKPELLVAKVGLLAVYTMLAVIGLRRIYRTRLLRTYEIVYLCGFVVLFAYENVFHFLLGMNRRLPFLPLMLTSVYCAIGVSYFWIVYYQKFVSLSSVTSRGTTPTPTKAKSQ